jgi:hypothetical protein
MITDFCMSLSRKKEDKVNNTGRFHLMKNRYGMDGITFGIEADTSTGHFTVKNEYDEDDQAEPLANQPVLIVLILTLILLTKHSYEKSFLN